MFGPTTNNSGGGLFGSTQTQPQPFGSSGMFGPTTNNSGGGLFGSTQTQPQPFGSSGMFGSTTNNSGGGLFGSTQTQPQPFRSSGMFGPTTNNSGAGLFGSTSSQAPRSQPQSEESSFFSRFHPDAIRAREATMARRVGTQPVPAEPRIDENHERWELLDEAAEKGELPAEMMCSILMNVMRDPVIIVETGNTYERKSLQQYWNTREQNYGSKKCPITNKTLTSTLLTNNTAIRNMIITKGDELLAARNTDAAERSGAATAAQKEEREAADEVRSWTSGRGARSSKGGTGEDRC